MSDPGAKENRKPGVPPPLSQPAARQNRAQSAPARAERASLSIEEEQQEKSKEAAELDHLVKGLKDLVLRRTLRRNSALAPGLASSSSQDCICVIYDLETTGLGKTANIGIVEVGALAVAYNTSTGQWKNLEEYHRFVRPKVPIQPGVPYDIPPELETAKPFEEQCSKEFHKFVTKYTVKANVFLAAHNGKRYDHRILCAHNFHPGKDVNAVDTIDVFKKAKPGHKSYSIKNLYADIWKTSVPAAHNAVPDCYALLRIMNRSPVITPELLMAHSEPWAAIVARCRK